MNDLKCFFGFHKYEVIEKEQITTSSGNVIGTVYVLSCKNCGKIITKNVYTKASDKYEWL